VNSEKLEIVSILENIWTGEVKYILNPMGGTIKVFKIFLLCNIAQI
jgi:hypothetical protein